METKQDATHSDICARLAQPCTDGSPNADACAQPQLLVLLTPRSWLPFTPPLPASRKPCLHTKQRPGEGLWVPSVPTDIPTQGQNCPAPHCAAQLSAPRAVIRQ